MFAPPAVDEREANQTFAVRLGTAVIVIDANIPSDRLRVLRVVLVSRMAGFAERVTEPFQAFIETIARRGTGRLDILGKGQLSERETHHGFLHVPKHAASSCGDQACR